MVHPEMVLRTCRGRGRGGGDKDIREGSPQTTTPVTHTVFLLNWPPPPWPTYISPHNWEANISPLLSLSLSPVTHHLLYLGHPTPSKSTTTVAIVTRGRGACCHRISPGPSHPAGTTDCSHCCITELLRLWGGGEEE